jgi:predicted small secreted protein
MKRFSLLMLAGLFLMTSVIGCNMMRGAGKDVESGGRGIQKIVDHND